MLYNHRLYVDEFYCNGVIECLFSVFDRINNFLCSVFDRINDCLCSGIILWFIIRFVVIVMGVGIFCRCDFVLVVVVRAADVAAIAGEVVYFCLLFVSLLLLLLLFLLLLVLLVVLLLDVGVDVNTSNHCPQYNVQTTRYIT